MKYSEKLLKGLNDLLTLNYEVEKIYIEALNAVTDTELKTFFKERGLERNEFGKDLMVEIENLNTEMELKFDGKLENGFYVTWMNFRRLFLFEDKVNLYLEICKLKELTISKYDDLLNQKELPHSTITVLERQKAQIQKALNAIIIEKNLVA
ncbi:DUF2383 domain-containing protein [Algibacter amylolyticus]|uniref:DUF2383 domain-containing protein n=1 Tax=Algibacter amylolyticus TaxID=1608400 RepID=A0A5M7BGA1_9FLAO|nr:DUF2383 domain-containing protein [Algibacter amylolyticus]KAA5827943.1 DUF2383 domain-containing protein [Algibacter amylolyticus]MBB5267177.1 uncharacterized protein (TIGR02284 family) [Algibacter amylolyticus]TSJ82188.1 DUF2383 domain-containing protein [Algibacter amylolyticus]